MNPLYADTVTVAENGCWIWTGRIQSKGYGVIVRTLAHRYVYEIEVGPIPDDLQLDHVCHSRDKSCPGGITCPHRPCVNPAHLEPVTPKINVHRGRGPSGIAARKTHCPQGHPYAGTNLRISRTTGGRVCGTCHPARRDPLIEAGPVQRMIDELIAAGISYLSISKAAGIGKNRPTSSLVLASRAEAISEVRWFYANEGRMPADRADLLDFVERCPVPESDRNEARLVS